MTKITTTNGFILVKEELKVILNIIRAAWDSCDDFIPLTAMKYNYNTKVHDEQSFYINRNSIHLINEIDDEELEEIIYNGDELFWSRRN